MIKRAVCLTILLVGILSLSVASFAGMKSKHLSPEEKHWKETVVYLTFDDGPSVENTGAILDILKNEDIKATFFITGPGKDHIISEADWTRLVRRMASEGHVVGNHTYDHRYETVYKSAKAFMNSVDRLDHAVFKATGQHTTVFRFPGGSNNSYIASNIGKNRYAERVLATLLRHRGYRYFDWNVSSADAAVATNKANVILSYVKKGVSENSRAIVLHHDSKTKTTTVEALVEEIRWMKEQGCTFDTLDHAESSYLFRTQWKTK